MAGGNEARLRKELEVVAEINRLLRQRNEKLRAFHALQAHTGGVVETYYTLIAYELKKYYWRNYSLGCELWGDPVTFRKEAEAMSEEFVKVATLDGKIPIEKAVSNCFWPVHFNPIFTEEQVAGLVKAFQGHVPPPQQAENSSLVPEVYHKYHVQTDKYFCEYVLHNPIAGAEAAIMDSWSPWYEALCLVHRAKPTTIHWLKIDNRCSQLQAQTRGEAERNGREYGVVISINRVAAKGLGFYGEPLAADGDFREMQWLRQLVKKDGRLLLGIPVGKDKLIFNATRIYGNARLPRLLEGWSVVEKYGYYDNMLEHHGCTHALLVLKRDGK